MYVVGLWLETWALPLGLGLGFMVQLGFYLMCADEAGLWHFYASFALASALLLVHAVRKHRFEELALKPFLAFASYNLLGCFCVRSLIMVLGFLF